MNRVLDQYIYMSMCINGLWSLVSFMNCRHPRIVSLLSESYNPHVRYGAALAVGISCAGIGSSEAISLLEPLTSDVVDFVRQGALIAMAMVMVQISEASDSVLEDSGPAVLIFMFSNIYSCAVCLWLKLILGGGVSSYHLLWYIYFI